LVTSRDEVLRGINQDLSKRGYEVEPDNLLQGLGIYYALGFFWTFNWIIAIAQCTIAGAIASWYWTRDKSVRSLPPNMTIGFTPCTRLESPGTHVTLPSWIVGVWRLDHCRHSNDPRYFDLHSKCAQETRQHVKAPTNAVDVHELLFCLFGKVYEIRKQECLH
jgi:hypothetical protein